jgi:hypothetical protein
LTYICSLFISIFVPRPVMQIRIRIQGLCRVQITKKKLSEISRCNGISSVPTTSHYFPTKSLPTTLYIHPFSTMPQHFLHNGAYSTMLAVYIYIYIYGRWSRETVGRHIYIYIERANIVESNIFKQ